MTDQTNKQNAGKSPVFQGCFAYFPRALKAVAMVSQYGKTKYKVPWTKKNWLQVAEGDLLDAQCRHILDRVIEGDINHTDGDLLHQAQVCWGALAALEVSLIAEEAAPLVDLGRARDIPAGKIDDGPKMPGLFNDVMGDVMEARIVREKDGVSTLVPYQPSPGARYVVPDGFDLETKTTVSHVNRDGTRTNTTTMSWYNFFVLYVNPDHWPEGFKQKETKI